MPKKKEAKLKPVVNYVQAQPIIPTPPKPQTIPCDNYKHRVFSTRPGIGVGVCLICNPDYSRHELLSFCNTPEQRETYEVLQAAQECYALGCLQRGKYDDTLEHRWCDKHIAAAYWLAEGARQGFPRLEMCAGITLLEGRDAWVKNARVEDVGIMRHRAARYCCLDPEFFDLLDFLGITPQEIPDDDIWYIDALNTYQEYLKNLADKGGHDGEVEYVEGVVSLNETPVIVAVPLAEEEHVDFSL